MVPHPLHTQAHPPVRPPIKPESPRARPRQTTEVKDGTPKKQKQCNCKHSRCLKLYCECFASGIYCDGCNCVNCHNNVEDEDVRREAVEATLERNPNAFRPKIVSSPHGTRDNRNLVQLCLLLPPLLKKRKGQELLFGSTAKDPSTYRHPQFQQISQANNMRGPASSCVGNSAAPGPSKSYRSLLEGIIQPEDFKQLCSVLVVYTGETGKIIEDRNAAEKQAEVHRESSLTLSTQDRCRSQKEADAERSMIGDCSSANQTEKVMPDESSSDGADVPIGRPMSPGTLALMCDEQDTMFASSQSGVMGHGGTTSSQLLQDQCMTEIYAEQERTILTNFRDCLNKLITLGQIKERKLFPMAQTELEDQIAALSNSNANARMETRNHQELYNNGAPHSPLPPVLMTQMVSSAAVSASAASHSDLQLRIPFTAENGNLKPKNDKPM
ncbi:protein tesmin/TSO1-like CXC 5 [Apium graveolens]|uniref:protein tesmin/TSO1-like CXC 5 n=1 Tax=Apium graveolens TaxID=4045 RepID=UPI003D7B7C1B